MKRPSYRKAIEYIALNDEPLCMDVEYLSGFISVQVVSVLFGVDSEKIARDIVKYKEKNKCLDDIN
jgi:hypothetical protein